MTTQQIPQATLERAAKLLQSAHDYIETHGFNILSYDGRRSEGARCYIGTVRGVAEIKPAPGHSADPSDGDGPELKIALAAMDKIARNRLRSLSPETLKKSGYNRFPDWTHTGRFVEHLGFLVSERAKERFPNLKDCRARMEYEKEYALKLLRKALTDLHPNGGFTT